MGGDSERPDGDGPAGDGGRDRFERDLRDELAFHLERSASELERDGMSPEEAAAEARARFGDPAMVRRAVRRAAEAPLRWRLRALTGALAAALAALGGLGALTVTWERAGREREATLARDNRALGEMIDAAPVTGTLPLAQSVRFVTVRGAVMRPAVWTLTRSQALTLRQIVAKSGGLAPGAAGAFEVTIDRWREVRSVSISAAEWANPAGLDPELVGHCEIEAR